MLESPVSYHCIISYGGEKEKRKFSQELGKLYLTHKIAFKVSIFNFDFSDVHLRLVAILVADKESAYFSTVGFQITTAQNKLKYF